jgi:hypothetical protein
MRMIVTFELWVQGRAVAELLEKRRCQFVRPNVRGNRPAEAGGVRLVCDSAEGTAHQPYTACRSGSG